MLFYPKNAYPVNWEYVTGRYCAHNWLDRPGRACLAVDLYLGRKRLIHPTMPIAAFAARIHPVCAWQEYRCQLDKEAIQARRMNGAAPAASPTTVPSPSPASQEVNDREVVDFVRAVGVGRVIEAACAVEAAQ
jgi:hypothetical protein